MTQEAGSFLRTTLLSSGAVLLFMLFFYSPYKQYVDLLSAKNSVESRLEETAKPNIVIKEPVLQTTGRIYIDYYNESSVGATEALPEMIVTLGAIAMNPIMPDGQSSVKLAPHHSMHIETILEPPIYSAVTSGKTTLSIQMKIPYKSPHGEGLAHSRFIYEPQTNHFSTIMSR